VISNRKPRKPVPNSKRAERRLIQKEENIDRKTEAFDQREKEITNKEKSLSDRDKRFLANEEKYNSLLAEQKAQLEKFLR
jgi:ribonuclease Y